MTIERGPEVRTTLIRTHDRERRKGSVHELYGLGGCVYDEAGSPVANAWVALLERGKLATTDRDGRFRFDSLGAGSYTVNVRAPDGRTAGAKLRVPDEHADLVLGAAGKRTRD
jgi:protocatechuate 3,4-dioxygenase beta subunit